MRQSLKDHLFLHFLVVLWGFTAVLGKLITIPAVEITWHRTWMSAAGLAVVVWILGKSFRISEKRAISRLFMAGILFGIHWITFFLSVKVSNVSTCLIGMASTAFWTSFLEPLIQKQPFRPLKVLFSIFGVIGIVFIFSVDDVENLGLALALGSSLCASLFTILNAQLSKGYSPFVITFYEMLVAFLAISLFLFFYGSGAEQILPVSWDWVYLLILAVVCTVFAYSYGVELMRRLAPFTFSFTLNLEPVYGIVLALILFGESELMSGDFYVGTLIILSSVIAYPFVSRRYFGKISKLEP
jgi:drug/metabolite transporter (DMT)-like permease